MPSISAACTARSPPPSCPSAWSPTRLQDERSAPEIVYISQRRRLPALLPGAVALVLAPARRLRRRRRVPLPPQLRGLAEAAAGAAPRARDGQLPQRHRPGAGGSARPAGRAGPAGDAGARAAGGAAGRRHRLRQRPRPARARQAGGGRAVRAAPMSCRPRSTRRCSTRPRPPRPRPSWRIAS